MAVAAMLSLWVPLARAAPPANDDFANRETLSGPLPIDVTRSNVEATSESGENLGGLAPAGHSVWFEWEAPSTQWVTVGACQSDAPALVGVFTGNAVNALTKVAEGIGSEGPNCPFAGREFTFKAQEGTHYEIAVDGDAYFVATPPPATEGAFTLRIETRPPPANDDFADAQLVTSALISDPNGPHIYRARIYGYNWGATKQLGEPDPYGVSGGSSVWYRWTPPMSGLVGIDACCGFEKLITLYTGSVLTGLTPVASNHGFSHT
ncbi:MAG TPA: hypothetical protein VFJ57_13120 [Solirubrobacterales bacterium]|nr:hypothetical protein [Solirubrobacterales bacterium]